MPPAPHPIEPDEHRRARHLFILKSLTERGFALANKVADQAETQLDAPGPQPGPAPAFDAPPPPTLNIHQTFERYVRLVRMLVTVEHRIATHAAAPPRRAYRPAGPAPDPRRPQLRQFLHHATSNSPGRAALRRDIEISLDDALDRDPARARPAGEVLFEICQEFGLPFDPAKLPDEFLEATPTGPP